MPSIEYMRQHDRGEAILVWVCASVLAFGGGCVAETLSVSMARQWIVNTQDALEDLRDGRKPCWRPKPKQLDEPVIKDSLF